MRLGCRFPRVNRRSCAGLLPRPAVAKKPVRGDVRNALVTNAPALAAMAGAAAGPESTTELAMRSSAEPLRRRGPVTQLVMWAMSAPAAPVRVKRSAMSSRRTEQ